MPSAAAAACRLVERHAVHTINVWITGQRSALLLLSQQSRHDPAGLFGGKDAPGGYGQPPRGHQIAESILWLLLWLSCGPHVW
jgi:hypothetical protein